MDYTIIGNKYLPNDCFPTFFPVGPPTGGQAHLAKHTVSQAHFLICCLYMGSIIFVTLDSSTLCSKAQNEHLILLFLLSFSKLYKRMINCV